MFTFGREHEIKCAIEHVGNQEKAIPLVNVVKLTHDYLEGSSCIDELKQALYYGISEGAGSVWESTGKWLRKLSHDSSWFKSVWVELSSHKLAKVRFRIAAFITDAPNEIFLELVPKLLKDKSVNVRSKLAQDLSFSKNTMALEFLYSAKDSEVKEDVIESIDYSISILESSIK